LLRVVSRCGKKLLKSEILRGDLHYNAFYANKHAVIRRVAQEAFGDIPLLMFKEYWDNRAKHVKKDVVVALGQNSGREIKLGTTMSMDWVLARVKNRKLIEYVGIEAQSIDITGNYRDNWHYFKQKEFLKGKPAPPSENGYNWANVHKRLIPQIIRKGLIYGSSDFVKHGLFFILPEIVYTRFEHVIGELKHVKTPSKEVMTVHTYELGDAVPEGKIRPLRPVRTVQFLAKDFASAFIAGASLPSGNELDKCVRNLLGVA
jgi:hypothetical protein